MTLTLPFHVPFTKDNFLNTHICTARTAVLWISTQQESGQSSRTKTCIGDKINGVAENFPSSVSSRIFLVDAFLKIYPIYFREYLRWLSNTLFLCVLLDLLISLPGHGDGTKIRLRSAYRGMAWRHHPNRLSI